MRAIGNPWAKGLMAFSVGAGVCGVLFAVGLMVAMAAGADVSRGPMVGSQAAGIILLSVTAVLVFVLVMSVRWDVQAQEGAAMSEHDEAQWVEANRDELIRTTYGDEMPPTRTITEGTGLSFGNHPHGSLSITLSDEASKELAQLRKHYIDAERSYALRAWQASNQGGELDTSVYYGWRSDAEAKWAAEFPQLNILLAEAAK